MLDVLIVVDNRDEIKQCVHQITSTLRTVKPQPRIKTASIYDLDNEKSQIWCKKVLFILTETKKSLRLRAKSWVDKLPLIKGNKDKYFVINVKDKTSMDIAEEESEVKHMNKDNILTVTNLKDIFTWWSPVLKFTFINNRQRMCVSKSSTNYFLEQTTDPVLRMVEMFDKIDKFLEDFGAQRRSDKNQCKCGLVFMKHKAYDIASTITQPQTTELDQITELINAQKERRNRECVYIITNSSAPIPDEIQKLTRLAHNKLQIMRCLLWMLIDLKLINVRKYDPQLGELDFYRRPTILVIRRIMAVLVFLVNLPVFIVEIILIPPGFFCSWPALCYHFFLSRLKLRDNINNCDVTGNFFYTVFCLSSLWILFIDMDIDGLPLNFGLGIFIYTLPPLYFIGWLTIVHLILKKYCHFKRGVYSIPTKLWR